MIAVIRALLTWFAGGSALAALGSVAAAASALILGLIYRRYVGILGADRRRPAERQAYDALRASFTGGNLAARLYAQWLKAMLGWVDRFFGDAGMADRTLFPHAFGLRNPAPLWTAAAFDRCLLLALIYPIVTIFVIWAISGHVGPAEAALRLPPSLPGWERGLLIVSIIFVSGAVFRAGRSTGWRMAAWVAGGLAVVFAFAFAFPGVAAGVVAFAGAVAATGAFAVVLVVVVAVGIVIAFAFPFPGGLAFAFAGVAAFAVIGAVEWANDAMANRGRRGVFLSFFVAIMMLACLVAASLLSPLEGWEGSGPLLLFLGLLTLLNAPFDWASLGLTRALLRRGLEVGGWAPYFLALVDAALAAGVIVLLTLAMVIGVQAFDELAAHAGGKAVLPLNALFDGIAAHPSAPEYWWVYALLLSSMIPSLINLVIGGTSLIRGVPGVPSLLLFRFMPDKGGVLKWDRHWIAAALTTQVAAGAILGIAAQAFLVVVILGYIMPFFGLELLGMARDVAAFNLPMRTWQFFAQLL